MPLVVDVTFRGAVRLQVVARERLALAPGDCVVIRTSRGLELARVRGEPVEIAQFAEADAGVIERKATEADLRRAEDNRHREEQALRIAEQKIAEHTLPMKLISAEATLDGGRLTIHFSSEGRVDFRALVRDLARALHARIELHQIGVRDEARMRGGLGPCGRALCCSSFLTDFAPVGIKMAKEQDLSLNPQKISGVCSRLMCCLNYEYEHYRAARRCVPKLGSVLQTEQGAGKLIEIDVLRDQATLILEDGNRVSLPLATVAVHRPGCPHQCGRTAPTPDEEPDLGPEVLPEEP
jgi:cell fate regulator YaaT (PSP1 superfamily)